MAKVKTLFLKIYNNLLLFYSVMFLLTVLLGFSYVYTKGMVLVSQSGDNYTQHFKAFVYYSDFIKGILKRLVFERRLVIPHWDFGIGEGYDILTTFNYYGMGDPINIPFILFPRKIISIAFSLGNILRLYLMGLGVVHYCRVSLPKTDNAAYVAGALSYAFCGFALSNVRGHTIFLTALAALPFLFAVIESYLKERRR
ncbi:MAG: YfhO family protein, partial [Lachnospiraceae bacterium]|nr:YfhO family protein [Lachnospiraceae bacterium]